MWVRELVRFLDHHRGLLVGALASSIAVVLTLDPQSSLARSATVYSVWFALTAVGVAMVYTLLQIIVEHRAARPWVPRASSRSGARHRTS